jgi:uncharacterized membrane protein
LSWVSILQILPGHREVMGSGIHKMSDFVKPAMLYYIKVMFHRIPFLLAVCFVTAALNISPVSAKDLMPKPRDTLLAASSFQEATGNVQMPVNGTVRSNGFVLAISIMVGMAAALVYSIIAFIVGRSFHLPAWADWLIPVLIVVGIGVAGYLSYVETQAVGVICGPIGDCNTVQQSRYARLFDVLPVGVLGLTGYLALLVSWLFRRYVPTLEKPAAIGFFGLAFFAVLFSLYLTYLEPFIIKAVCMWCLFSAVIASLLLLLGLPPAIRQFTVPDEEE